MIETIDRKELINILGKGRHVTGEAYDLLPFVSMRGNVIQGNFNLVISSFVRNLTNIKVKKNIDSEEAIFDKKISPLVKVLKKNIEFEDDQGEYDFERFINTYLFEDNELKAIHPYLINFIDTPESQGNQFGKYGQFLSDVFVQGEEDILKVFKNKESNDILTNLILDNIDSLKEDKETKNSKQFQDLLPNFTKLYREDLKFLTKNPDYFLESFTLLTHFYTFMYPIQLLLHLDTNYIESINNDSKPLVFALEWESLTKKRQAADNIYGYQLVENINDHLFPHIHTISQLSYNFLNNSKSGKNKVYSYSELYNEVRSRGEAFEYTFGEDLKMYIKEYINLPWHKKSNDIVLANSVPELFKQLFNLISERMNSDVKSKYGDLINRIGYGQFLKNRGSLGKILNIKHDFLMLLTAVVVKDERMPFNTVMDEFEKRGISFDRHSKKEIVDLFNSHNLLDKKSDSGDALYVKPIL